MSSCTPNPPYLQSPHTPVLDIPSDSALLQSRHPSPQHSLPLPHQHPCVPRWCVPSNVPWSCGVAVQASLPCLSVVPVPVALPTRRVHISQSTMDCLKGEFDVEPGDGGSRCDYLDEKGIETYLIIASGPYVKKSSQNGSVRPGGIWCAG